MLPIPGVKSTRKEDLSSSLFEAVARERGEAAASTVVPACRAIQELRTVASEPPTTPEIRKALLAYLKALTFLRDDAKLTEPLERDLLWVNAFDNQAVYTSKDLDLDRVSITFNLAVCEANLAIGQYRSHGAVPNALAKGALHFTSAAAFFRHTASYPVPGGASYATSDLYPECLEALESLMLGNAQQLRYLQATEEDEDGKFFHNINARFAAGAAHYYAQAAGKCTDHRLVNTTVRASIGMPAAALSAYFSAMAEIHQAKICEKHCRMGEQLARLKNAREYIDSALKQAKDIDTKGLPYLQPIQTNVLNEAKKMDEELKEMQQKADKENIHVYFGVDPDKTTKPIAIREAAPADISAVVKDTPLDERLKPLKDLPTLSASELNGTSAAYSASVAKTVGNQVAVLINSSANLRETMVQADTALHEAESQLRNNKKNTLPTASNSGGKKVTDTKMNAEDEAAVAAVKAAKNQGGLKALKDAYANALSLASDTRLAITNIENTLAGEAAEDAQLRARMGYVPRADSKNAAAGYTAKLTQSKGSVEKARNADEVVDQQIRHHEHSLEALDKLDVALLENINTNKPGTHVVMGANNNNKLEMAIDQLKLLLGQCRNLLGDSSTLTQELEQKKHLENPITATARITNMRDVDDLVRTNYEPLMRRVDVLSKRMHRFVTDVGRARSGLSLALATTTTNTTTTTSNSHVDIAYRHQAAALKFEELRSFLADGVRFYTNEQTALARLASDVAAFVATRHAEAVNLGLHGNTQTPGNIYHYSQPPPPPQYGMHQPYQGAYNAPYQPPPPQNNSNNYWPGAQPPHDPRNHP